ncbi:hypothetical protein F5Y12DRAFT_798824 [Xylaria sp. FL1777]|nr:hypothetical protein F5Y12DRAFT_798824 [Xylaria sp. FL1777]
MDTRAIILTLRRALSLYVQFIYPGTPHYDHLNRAMYRSGLNSDFRPACIILPRNGHDVSIFIKTIRPFIIMGRIKFAIVSRGRQQARGCSNIDKGIVLNLGFLKGIRIGSEWVTIGVAECWENVYAKLQEEGLACAGALSGGVCGKALQGGLSIFSSQHGFICDQVIGYKIVLACGTIIHATAKNHVGLWMALRGGGNNFGIVISITMRTFKQGSIYGGHLLYPQENFYEQIAILIRELNNPYPCTKTYIAMSLAWMSDFDTEPIAVNELYYSEGVENPPALRQFQPQSQLPGSNTLRIQTLVEAARQHPIENERLPHRSASMNIHVKAQLSPIIFGATLFKEAVNRLKDCKGLICVYSLYPYQPSLLAASATLGSNVLCVYPNFGPIIMISIFAWWTKSEDDDKILREFDDILTKTEQKAEVDGLAVRLKYMNYAASFQDPIGSYGLDIKEKLQIISKLYDPHGIFQKGVPGGWKLFDN